MSGNWETKGWWNIKPNEEVYVENTQNLVFYFFAYNNNSKWEGDDLKITFQGTNYGLRKKEIKDPLGKTTVNLTCGN